MPASCFLATRSRVFQESNDHSPWLGALDSAGWHVSLWLLTHWPSLIDPLLNTAQTPWTSPQIARRISPYCLATGYLTGSHDEGSHVRCSSLGIWSPAGLAMPSGHWLFAVLLLALLQKVNWKKRGSGTCSQKTIFSAVIFKHLLRAFYTVKFP